MQIIQFKYYLRRYNTIATAWEYFYVDGSNVVQTSFTPTELPQAPRGWEGQTLNWERGFEWYGVFTNYSNPLQFVNDGARVLKNIYYNTGIEGNCQLYIEKHTNEVSTWGYEEYYKGDIDFSRFKDMKDYVEISITESGFLAKLKANETTNREIEVTDNADVIWVKMDGIELKHRTNWTNLDNEVVKDDLVLSFKVPSLVIYGTPTGVSFNLVPQDQLMLLVGDVVNMYVNSGSVSQDVEMVCDYNYNVSSVTSFGYFGLLYAILSPTSPSAISASTTYWIRQATVPLSAGQSATYTGTDTQTITVPAGMAVRMVIGWFDNATFTTLNSSASVDVTALSGSISGSLVNIGETTYIPALRSTKVLETLCEFIDADVNVSDTPASNNSGYVLTSGDALRNLEGSIMKTSFSDYLNAHNCMFNSAFYFDKVANEVQFRYKYGVFDVDEAVMDLGEVNNIEVSPFIQEMFTKMRFGYPNNSYDDYNGKDEFNTENKFSTSIARVTNEKNLVSTYRADMYGIELTRINLTGKKEATEDSDNDIFWLHIDDSSPAGTVPAGNQGAGQDYYDLYRDSGLTITGVLSPSTAFNIDLSPKRRMYTWGYWIRSMVYPNLSQNLTFTSSAKTQENNVALETDDGVTVINEKTSEIISGLPGTDYSLESPNRYEIFYPLVFTIDVKIPSNIMELMNNPHREFSFTYKGNTYYGWLLQVSDEPTYTPKQTYKLIASTSNNLTTLINGI